MQAKQIYKYDMIMSDAMGMFEKETKKLKMPVIGLWSRSVTFAWDFFLSHILDAAKERGEIGGK